MNFSAPWVLDALGPAHIILDLEIAYDCFTYATLI